MNVDYITSAFQAGAVLFLCANIIRLWKDGELKGISIWMMVYFTIWGYWGVFMWADLQQPWSMWTNVGIAVAYTIWLGLALFIKFMNSLDRN